MNALKLLCILAIVTAVPTSTLAQQDPAIADDMRISPISRTTIFVRDLEESLKLYRDILGLKPRMERDLSSEIVNELLGTSGENKVIRVAILNATGDDWTGDVGLIQYVEDSKLPPVVKPPRVETGDVALVFVTADMLGIYEEVKEAGYTIIAAPTNPTGATGPNAAYEFMFFDRDGIIVNLIQRAK